MGSKPNVIVIMADDMGYGDLGCMNQGLSSTPALDRLYGESMVFSQGYAASCVCAPSRAGFLCGRYPVRTGCTCLNDIHALNRLDAAEITIGDVFKCGGYRTGLVGKWHCGTTRECLPQYRGFDEIAAFHPQQKDYWDWSLDLNGAEYKGDGTYLTDALTDKAIEFVERNRNVPFFLHLAYYAPHRPLQAPEELLKKYRERENLTSGQALVYAMIESMDTGIAMLLDVLERFGILENTIVVFTSDNGPDSYSVNGISPERFNCGLRGGKYNVFEGGIRVPLMVRWPAGQERSGINDSMFHFIDLLPTLADACGVKLLPGHVIDGESRLKVWRGDEQNLNPVRFWQWNRHFPVLGCNAAMRDGKWKLVRPAMAGYNEVSRENVDMIMGRIPYCITPPRELDLGSPEKPLLFDLEADPLENMDLSGHHPARVAAMTASLDRWQCDTIGDFRRIIASRFL